MPIPVFSHPAMLTHEHGPGHPERPDRLRAALDAVETLAATHPGVFSSRLAVPIDPAFLKSLHATAYVDRLLALRGQTAQLDPDTAVGPTSIDAALLAVGACVQAVDAVIDGPTRRACALVRPPGHHAEHDRAMGFCYFGNIALAAEHAIRSGLQRVLIADFDVHHGNGTQHLLHDRSDILVFNTHQWPLFPGTGQAREIGIGPGKGFTVNCPLPLGTTDADLFAVYRELLVPIAHQFKPDLVLVSAGFDGHADDPLAAFELTAPGFANLTAVLMELADRHAHGRLVLVLEGGYDLGALRESLAACLAVLAGSAPPPKTGVASATTLAALAATRRALGSHWVFPPPT